MMPGVCQYCKVTDDQVDGNKLSWHDASRTCCSKYACVKAHHNASRIRAARPKSRFAAIAAAHPSWGRGAIAEELRRQEQRAKRARRKDRAA